MGRRRWPTQDDAPVAAAAHGRERRRRQRPEPAAAVSCLTRSALTSPVGASPRACSNWRRARRVAAPSAPSGLTAYPSFASAICAVRTRCDPSSTGSPRKRAAIGSGERATGRRSPGLWRWDADDDADECCAAGPIDDVVSGADVLGVRSLLPSSGATAVAVFNAAAGAWDANACAGWAVAAVETAFAEAGKGSFVALAKIGAGCRPVRKRSALPPIPATIAARLAPTAARLGVAITHFISRRAAPRVGPRKGAELRMRMSCSIKASFPPSSG